MENIFAKNITWSIGIVVVLFGIIAAHRLASYRGRKGIFNAAAKEFIDTFHKELKEIYPTPANWPNNIDHYLRARFDNLNEAIGKFKRHLFKRERKAFDDAWFRYYCCTGREVDRNRQCYLDYYPFTGSSIENGVITHHDTTKTYKQTFKNNVDTLLNFAKPK